MRLLLCVLVALCVATHTVHAAQSSVVARLKEEIETANQQIGSSSSKSISATLSSLSSALSSLSTGSGSGSAIPATRLQSGSSDDGSSGGCAEPDPCQNPVSFGPPGAGGAGGGVKVEEAIKPVEDWIKDFKKRALGDGSNLFAAAKATVKPLLTKLKRTMKRAEERLAESNLAILRHVEEVTITHIYNLLKADQTKAREEEKREEMVEKLMAAKQEEKEARENLNAQLNLNSEQVNMVDKHVMEGTLTPAVLEKIAKLIASEQASAQSEIAASLKSALSESSGKSGSESSSGSGSKSGSKSSKSGSSSLSQKSGSGSKSGSSSGSKSGSSSGSKSGSKSGSSSGSKSGSSSGSGSGSKSGSKKGSKSGSSESSEESSEESSGSSSGSK